MKWNLLLLFIVINLRIISQEGFIIDHRHTDLSQIPEQYINAAKSNLKIRYFRRSHGSQLDVGGMAALRRYSNEYNDLYAYNSTGANNELKFSTLWNSLDFENDTWLSITRDYGNDQENSEINVVMWAWSSNFYEMDVDQYLADMELLISEYGPGGTEIIAGNRSVPVTFIFQTACGQRSPTRNQAVYIGNQKIREHCLINNRISFDFNDLECYDPDGNYYGDGTNNGSYTSARMLNDDLAYISDSTNVSVWDGGGNWGIEWVNRNPNHELSQLSADNICTVCEHSMGTHEGETKDNARLHCVLKGRAAWWLWAKLAGWGNRHLVIEADQALTEENLDQRSIDIAITGDSFIDNVLETANFQLIDVPPGLSVESVSYVDETHAVVYLLFNGTDFDIDYPDFKIYVSESELISNSSLTSNIINITAYDESVQIVPVVSLTEMNLNEGVLNLSLIDSKFSNNQLDKLNFQLNNAPIGTSIESIQYVDTANAEINLEFDNTDFDVDYTNFSITVSSNEISAANMITSNEIIIEAINELNPYIELSSNVNLDETNLGQSIIYIEVYNDEFVDTELDNSNIELFNAPQGCSVKQIDYVDSVKAELTLDFDGTDFDESINNFNVKILAVELKGTEDVKSDYLSINAIVETEATFHIHPESLIEPLLNNAEIQLKLVDLTFSDNNLEIINFHLNNAPKGFIIEHIEYVTNDSAVVKFEFDGTDFDSDYTNFSITIMEDEIDQTTSITCDEHTIIAELEPMAFLETENDLKESELNNTILHIVLDDEIINANFSINGFELNNGPSGLYIDSVYMLNDTSIFLILGFDETDFDSDIDGFSVTVKETTINGDKSLITNNKTIVADVVSSVNDFKVIKSLRLFPNPNKGAFKLSIDMEHQEIINISIVDLSGKRVEQRVFYARLGINMIEFDLLDKTSGIRIIIAKFADKQIALPIFIK